MVMVFSVELERIKSANSSLQLTCDKITTALFTSGTSKEKFIGMANRETETVPRDGEQNKTAMKLSVSV